MDEQAVARQIEATLLADINNDRLTLPALPKVVERAMTMLLSDTIALADVAATIALDPTVAARVVRLANSAAIARPSPAASIGEAVTRLGVNQLRLLLVEVAAQAVFRSPDPQIAQASQRMFEHSLAVALLSRAVAERAPGTSPETAYLVGLLHDIGKPIVAASLLESERRLRGRRAPSWLALDTWQTFVLDTHRRVGVALARKWGLPDAVERAITDVAAYDLLDPPNTANVVRYANALAKWAGMHTEPVMPADTDAILVAGRALLGLTPEVQQELCDGLEAGVRARLA